MSDASHSRAGSFDPAESSDAQEQPRKSTLEQKLAAGMILATAIGAVLFFVYQLVLGQVVDRPLSERPQAMQQLEELAQSVKRYDFGGEGRVVLTDLEGQISPDELTRLTALDLDHNLILDGRDGKDALVALLMMPELAPPGQVIDDPRMNRIHWKDWSAMGGANEHFQYLNSLPDEYLDLVDLGIE